MNRHALPVVASVLLSAMLSACAHAPSQGMMMSTTTVITNTGATNLIGWRILIGQYGAASWQSGDGAGQSLLPAALGAKLMQDIAHAGPLSDLPAEACAKSASFGTSTFLTANGARTPDLSCPGNDKARALKDDVSEIATYLSVRNVPRGQGRDLPPENF